MPRGCDEPGCTNKHCAKGKCRYHYKMPSRNPEANKDRPPGTEIQGGDLLKPKGRGNFKPTHRVLSVTPSGDNQIVTKTKKPKTETLPQLIKRTEKVFNAWIRKRDTLSDLTFRCISCDLYKRKSEMDAGHFYPVRYSALRFHEDNVHGECIQCNRNDPNHLKGYRIHLEEKIGSERLKTLKDLRNQTVKWDRQDLLDIIEKYK